MEVGMKVDYASSRLVFFTQFILLFACILTLIVINRRAYEAQVEFHARRNRIVSRGPRSCLLHCRTAIRVPRGL
jgi:hypothetical protein